MLKALYCGNGQTVEKADSSLPPIQSQVLQISQHSTDKTRQVWMGSILYLTEGQGLSLGFCPFHLGQIFLDTESQRYVSPKDACTAAVTSGISTEQC